MSAQLINITSSTIFRAVLILTGLYFIWFIRDIIVLVFVAVVIAAAINGPASWLQRYRVPRILGVIFVYLVIMFLLGVVVTMVFPPLAEQVKALTSDFPGFMKQIGLSVQELWSDSWFTGNLQEVLGSLSVRLSQATTSVIGTIIGLFGGLFSALIVLVISFYLSIQERGVKKFIISLTPEEHHHYVSDLIDRIQGKIGAWLRGQLLLMLIIGVLTYIGLYFMGIDYALTLALIAGLLEIVPFVGPIIAAIPAAILGFIQAPILGLLVIILYIIIQQLENYVIVPQVMKKTVGLNPVVIIVVMLIGAKLAGILGIILSVPVTASIAEFFKDMNGK